MATFRRNVTPAPCRFSVGTTVLVAGHLRRLVQRVNTLGDWLLDAPVDGRLFWNETEMVRSEASPTNTGRQKYYQVRAARPPAHPR